ncbi:squalene--hopene cyclase [Nocardia transvalensis]|uniref:squalene--hopene cyclase n=1 Tax=Nocardia transvalensis TaxID=37333 RepID=UPI00189404B5|nr:squalene--hopene cyclase [Nocardia transvalensis]MBF6331961.1 squalene--hopene cyclase [Nocardia transvalensis]
MSGNGASAFANVVTSRDAARDHLLGLQSEAGWWTGEVESNVTMEAEDLLLREFLGIRTEQITVETAAWIRSCQNDDGTWSIFFGGPPNLSTTIEAYVALRLAGDDRDEAHMVRAETYIRGQGGIGSARLFTRIWLALLGQGSWHDLPAMPPEVMFLPAWAPLNLYDWAAPPRQTIVPLTIITAVRPCRPLPIDLSHLNTGRRPQRVSPRRWRAVFGGLDRVLHLYERRPVRRLRRAALRRAAEWILARQEADGSWGGIQTPWVYSLIALHLLGYDLDHPVMRRGLDGLDRLTIREKTSRGVLRRFQTCQSPIWDTALAIGALADAGVPGDHPALLEAAGWLLDHQTHGPGDWSVRRPDLAPGGWSFEFCNESYPDTDCTAVAVVALRRVQDRTRAADIDRAIGRATRWLAGMQSRDGGFGAFDADNTSTLCAKVPYFESGQLVDPPTNDVTAHVVEALALAGPARSETVRRGVAWLLRSQREDGSWSGRWLVNHIYGTGAAIPALMATGAHPAELPVRRAIRWLCDHQNPDGGWGEDPRSYADPAWGGRGTSTPSQTAWALLALLAAEELSPTVDRGIGWLVQHQRPDGTWDEPQHTATGYPGDLYFNFHLMRLVFPLRALGLYVAAHARRERQAALR